MRRVLSLVAGAVIAFTLAGCSEAPPESGTVPFKGTQNKAIDGMRDQMAKNVAGGKAASKADAKAKPEAETKAADAKVEKDAKAKEAEKKKD